jgi:hypothetical protein
LVVPSLGRKERMLSDRVWRALHHPGTAPVLLLVLALANVTLDRFPHWDEAVFLTQTAGKDGLDAPPAYLGPSREIGSVWKIGLLTHLSAAYPNIRLLHVLLGLILLAVAARSLQRVLGVPQAVIGIVLGSYWVTFAYLGQLLRFTPLTFVLLAALANYLLLTSDEPARSKFSRPLIVGSLFALGFLLGPFESAMVFGATVLHWLVRRGFSLRALGLDFAVIVATIVLLFGVPFILESRARYGTFAGRVEALGNIQGPMSQSAFDWSLLDDYIRLVFVQPVSNANYAPEGWLAQLAFIVAGSIMAVGILVGLRSFTRVILRKESEPATTLMSSAFWLFMFFLAGFYSAMSDRYFILPGSLLLLLGLRQAWRAMDKAATLVRARWSESRSDVRVPFALLGLMLFAVPNIAAASQVDNNWSGTGEASATLSLTRLVLGGESCVGATRYNAPAVQWATGCHVVLVRSFSDAVARTEAVGDGSAAFIYWRSASLESDEIDALLRSGWIPLLEHPPTGGRPTFQVLFRP